jgi:hypothetical protein
MPDPTKLTDAEYNARWVKRTLGRVVQNDRGCWVWQGPVNHRGYGLSWHRSYAKQVHRSLYQVIFGKLASRWQYVCHSCDTPACINPLHMWIGSPADNQKDMQRKGRGFGNRKKQPGRTRPNANAPRVNITPDEIRSLLAAAGVSQVHGAKLIGISERTMRRHIAGETLMIEAAAKALRALAT